MLGINFVHLSLGIEHWLFWMPVYLVKSLLSRETPPILSYVVSKIICANSPWPLTVS